jgi:ATP-dependent Clp protease ATP-binding subunit ClpB
MTSNIGSQFIMEEALDATERNRRVMEALRGHFRPEFLNRLDEIIIFDRLSDEEIRHIVGLQIQRLAKRLAGQNIHLEVTPDAMALVAREGYDPVYGARPLKRVIQREILDPLSMEILEGRFKEGDSVEVAEKDGEITFRKR